jgi:Tol biopolymer transport system component
MFARWEVPKSELMRFDNRSGEWVAILPRISMRTAAFSKDGMWLAYGSLTDNNLWRCRADGNECSQLTIGFQQVAMPRWSPDGRRIAFMARRFGEGFGVFVRLHSEGKPSGFLQAPARATRIGPPMGRE